MIDKVKPGDTVVMRDGYSYKVAKVEKRTGYFPYALFDNNDSMIPVDCYSVKGQSEYDWSCDIETVIPPDRCVFADNDLSNTEAVPAGDALRFNTGKTPYGNLPLDLLDGAARVMAYGAKKYGDSENFRKGYSELINPLHSIIRHTVQLQRAIQTEDKDGSGGYLLDKESGEGHSHHIVTSVLILIHSMRLQGYKV